MGRKNTVPYGLYRCHGYISAHLAKQTGFDEQDLELLWQSLANMFDHDHSAARGEMSCCALYVFRHDCELGNSPARKLFETIHIERISEGPARNYADYQVTVVDEALPQGVSLLRIVE